MKDNLMHEIFGGSMSVGCGCGYTAPTEYAPNKSQSCPTCGKSMPKPRFSL